MDPEDDVIAEKFQEKFQVKTVEEFLDTSDAGATSKRQYAVALRSMERMMGKSMIEASQRDAIALAKALRAKAGGPQYACIARMFYRKARREDMVELLELKQRVKRLKRDDLLSPKDVQAIVDVAESMRDKIFVALLWELGVRVSELLSVDLSGVKVRRSPANGDKKIYVLWFGQVKETGAEHEGFVIEAAPLLEKWLMAYPFAKTADAPLIPTQRGGRLSRRDGLIIIKRLAIRAGISKRVYCHLFRHSRTTWALASGMTEAQVKALYGWTAGSTMLSRYSHLTSKDAYKGLLRAQGLEPEKVEVEHLAFDNDDLRPAIPVLPPSPKPATSSPEMKAIDIKITDLEQKMSLVLEYFIKKDPELRAALEDEKGTSP
jgi:integrase